MTRAEVRPPTTGIAALRINLEFGGADAFAELVDRSLERGGDQGATLVALLDRGDLGLHLPQVDGPCWNAVPLLRLQPGEVPPPDAWATMSGILEKLERYR